MPNCTPNVHFRGKEYISWSSWQSVGCLLEKIKFDPVTKTMVWIIKDIFQNFMKPEQNSSYFPTLSCIRNTKNRGQTSHHQFLELDSAWPITTHPSCFLHLTFDLMMFS